MVEYYSTVYNTFPLFIIDGHLGYFYTLIYCVNKAAMNIGVQMFETVRFHFLSNIYPKVGLLDHMVVLFLMFGGTSTVFYSGFTNLYYH